jgi:hypothetical protein
MRNMVTGLVLAALLLGGLFYAAAHRAHRIPENPEGSNGGAVASVHAGFVGSKRIGAWILSCGPRPLVLRSAAPSSGDAKPGAATAPSDAGAGKSVSLGRCRTLLEFRRKDPPHAVAMTMAFRYLGGPAGRLAVFVRFGSGQKGEAVVLRLGSRSLKLPVAGCGQGVCMALGVLGADAEAAFHNLAQGEIHLPQGPDGTPRVAAVPLAGLEPAVAAMQRAEAGR